MKFSLVNTIRRESTIPSLQLDICIYLVLVNAHINGECPLFTILERIVPGTVLPVERNSPYKYEHNV